MNNATLEELTEAVKGLLYISETESPLTPFAVKSGAVDADRVLALAGADKDTTVEESSLDDFFRVVPSEDKPKFARVRKVLEGLTGLKVYKVGDEAEKALFVIGKDGTGNVMGLRTTVVET